jgi:nuclease-like protein
VSGNAPPTATPYDVVLISGPWASSDWLLGRPHSMTAPVPRRAGQHARGRVRRTAGWTLVVLAAVVGTAVVTGLAYGWHSKELVFAELVLLGVCGAITKLVEPKMDRWDRGATGEEVVGKVLAAKEADGWRALHDVSFGRGNIDHVVVGAGGLFTIETKSHPGRISVDRVHPRMLAQAYAESKALERVAGQPVVPLLVFSRAYIDRPRNRKGVVVLPARMLSGHLDRRPQKLTQKDVDSLYRRLLYACG